MTYLYNDPVARAQFNAQGIATMGLCPDWDRALAGYIAADVRAKAQEDFGAVALRREDRDRKASDMEERYGKAWRKCPEGEAVVDRLAEENRADDRIVLEQFYEPMWDAQKALVLTPAPSLAAAVFKAAVIEIHDVWNDTGFKADCVAIIDSDFARFTGGAA